MTTHNTRLVKAMHEAKVEPPQLARRVGVDLRTVQRWIGGRAPFRRSQIDIAELLGVDLEYLWPDSALPVASTDDEIIRSYAKRADVPNPEWWNVISQATSHIDLLGYTLYFLSLQHPELVSVLEAKCAAGIQVRAIMADPDSEHVAYRDREEGTPLTLGVRIRTTLDAWRPLLDVDSFELRMQNVPLYNSVFRFDDHMFVTPHLYGVPGSHAPLLHLKRLGEGGLFDRFDAHFDAIWNVSNPYKGD